MGEKIQLDCETGADCHDVTIVTRGLNTFNINIRGSVRDHLTSGQHLLKELLYLKRFLVDTIPELIEEISLLTYSEEVNICLER